MRFVIHLGQTLQINIAECIVGMCYSYCCHRNISSMQTVRYSHKCSLSFLEVPSTCLVTCLSLAYLSINHNYVCVFTSIILGDWSLT